MLASIIRMPASTETVAAVPECDVVVLVGSVWKSWAYIGPALVQRVRDAHLEDAADGGAAARRLVIVRVEETCALGGLHAAAELLAGEEEEEEGPLAEAAMVAQRQIAARIAACIQVVEEVHLA